MATIDQLGEELQQHLQDYVRVLWLRREVQRLKADRYDQLAENIIGLRRAAETQERAADDLRQQLINAQQENQTLRHEYANLQERGSSDRESIVKAEQLRIFRELEGVLTQLPTMRHAVESGADIAAKDVLDIASPVLQAVHALGFEPIGQAGDEVAFDPKRHRAVGRAASDVTADDVVRVRYVGYMHHDEVVCKAQVTMVKKTTAVGDT